MAAHWTVMPLLSRQLYRVSGRHIRALCAGAQRVSPEIDGDMKSDYRDLLKQFPKPKELLHNVISSALRTSNIRDKLTYITTVSNQDYRVILRVKWPKPIQVEGCGQQEIDAERQAAAKLCKIFQDLGLLGSVRKFQQKNRVAASSAYSPEDEDCVEVDEEGGPRAQKVRKDPRHATLDTADDVAAMEALQEFKNPKHLLSTIIQVATSSNSKGHIKYQHEEGRIKTCRLTISWPQPFTFVAHGRRWAEADRKAAALACQTLKALGLLGLDNKPLTHAKYNHSSIQKLREQQQQARRFNVPEDLLTRMEDYFQEFPPELSSELESDMEQYPTSQMESTDDHSDFGTVSDPFTGHTYTPLSEAQADQISRSLNDKWRSTQEKPLQELPVDNNREAILSAVRSNPVVVIAGDTGCGKTTRIPRYILEDAILSGWGAQCNILITQPRRISAVSVAHRVGQELGPALRRNVGYQVRLESMIPSRGGALLFCTVGVLLKKLQSNPAMEGVSHVIVDEVHERDVSTDFLLILLKQMRELNPNVKVILMSATGDTKRISQYFGDCLIVRVPGFMYPVKQHYLEDILPMMGLSSYQTPETSVECAPDLDLISKVILHVDEHGEAGGILCFLPGWQEIRGVQDILQEALSDQEGRYLILPVHSNIPLGAQQSIFNRPPPGVRKIVLATNIAETSVTIDDIVHVVDCGMQKEQRYDLRTKVSCLETTWVSKSNVIQRRGRAGRCQPGFSYHLFTSQQYQEMEEFQMSEILRTPLENLVLQAKIHTPEMTAVEFLSQALECPDQKAIRDAVRLLQDIRVLDDQERLTFLGMRVAHITTDPVLAKAIVLSAIFRCLQPLLAIVACLTKDPFLSGILNRAEVNKAKVKFSGESCSDHLAFFRIFEAWKVSLRNFSRDLFVHNYVLSKNSLRFIQGLVAQFSTNACDAGLVPNPNDCVDDDALCNQLSSECELVKGVLLAGLYPNLIQVRRGNVYRGKFRPDGLVYRTKRGPVLLHRSTVNRGESRFRSPWLTYFQAVKSSGAVFVRDSSMVHPLAVLLMTDSFVTCDGNEQRMVLSLSDSDLLKLESDTRTIELLGALRQALRNMVERHLNERLPMISPDEEHQYTQLLSILTDLLNRTADCFRDPSEAEQ